MLQTYLVIITSTYLPYQTAPTDHEYRVLSFRDQPSPLFSVQCHVFPFLFMSVRP